MTTSSTSSPTETEKVKKQIQSLNIFCSNINYQNTPDELETQILKYDVSSKRSKLGAIVINTGEFTGRSPKDKFTVKDSLTEKKVFWNDFNIPFSTEDFNRLKIKLQQHLSAQNNLWVRDCIACADPAYQMYVRLITEAPAYSLFAHNMFLRPTLQYLSTFNAEWIILHAPSFKANPKEDKTRQHNFAIIDFSQKTILIGGTGYTGEIKKGIFTVLNFSLPVDKKVFTMHCSANKAKDGDTAIFFGLSGTGKTTLSTDPHRQLIGDDEHGWSNNGVFNFEGGCYAKCIGLSQEKEPEIYKAIKPHALLENIPLQANGEMDFDDASITENTRVSYPIYHIDNIATPSIGNTPSNIFFLTCDAFGVLPPISKLSIGEAMLHFLNGYTARVAGTEAGVKEPQPVFSNCFGAPFLPLNPTEYANMLGEKLKQHNTKVWLVNTGWIGGQYGVGERIKLKYTRALIQAAMKGELDNVAYEKLPIFNLNVPTTCNDVPSELLMPNKTWKNTTEYQQTATKLATLFINNFDKKFRAFANPETIAALPKL